MITPRKYNFVPVVLATLLFLITPAFATFQEPKSKVANSNGEGTLKIGRETFKVYAVVAKLTENGEANITLVSDITVFVSGTWAANADPKNGLDLRITGGATKGGLEGSGKLVLRDEGKSIAALKLQLVQTSLRRNIEVDFVGKVKS